MLASEAGPVGIAANTADAMATHAAARQGLVFGDAVAAMTNVAAANNPALIRRIIIFFIGSPLETFVLANKGYRAYALDGYTSGQYAPDYPI